MNESLVKESVLINVFEMFIKRLDELQDSINRMNNYLINEARYKTNDIISGSVFNYPFEIYNYKFDRKKYAYVYIKLTNDMISLYDIIWNIWDNNLNDNVNYTNYVKLVQNNLEKFMHIHFGEERYKELVVNISKYLNEKEQDEKYISCEYNNIDSCYEYLPEYILNQYITTNISNFKSFNHQNYCISINYVSENDLYVDELVGNVLLNLKQYGYKANNIEYIKVYGLDVNLHNLISCYDMNICDKNKRRDIIRDYLNGLCYCAKDKIRDTILDFLVSNNTDLPFFQDLDEVAYILDLLKLPISDDEILQDIEIPI